MRGCGVSDWVHVTDGLTSLDSPHVTPVNSSMAWTKLTSYWETCKGRGSGRGSGKGLL